MYEVVSPIGTLYKVAEPRRGRREHAVTVDEVHVCGRVAGPHKARREPVRARRGVRTRRRRAGVGRDVAGREAAAVREVDVVAVVDPGEG